MPIRIVARDDLNWRKNEMRWSGAFRFAVLTAFALHMCLLVGCKTDALTAEPVPEGPVTSLESPEGVDLPAIPVEKANEPDLVERVIYHRAMYARCLRALRDYYAKTGMEAKRRWAEAELAQLRQIKPYRYILEAEVPPPTLKPTASIPDADRLFDEAMKLMKKGGHGVPGIYNEKYIKQALAKLKQLVRQYPSSDKIDEAAYYIGLLHEQYFPGDEQIAVAWYERAWQWNPQIQLPARFQAAKIYDYRLHDRAKALELYRQVLKYETFNKANVRFARTRIEALTKAGRKAAEKALKSPEEQ